IDSLLGAAGLPDIGQLFPDTDPCYKDISSLRLLSDVLVRIRSKGLRVGNLDAVVVSEEVRVAPWLGQIRGRLGTELELSSDRLSVKGKTTEGLGFVGRGEGIAAFAVVTLVEA
ncbi:MAG: 2-C-methyl-D-erythritol 2,4-cyclodiphosphate synthase, partial [candidate division WOR-3 bacterium]